MSKHAALYEKIFGEKYVKESYKYIPHSFTKRIVGKQVCSRCGLIALNNKITQWAIDKGCNHSDHPSYRNKLKALTGD